MPGGPASRPALGADFALPSGAADGRDLVVHTSATSAGLQLSLDLLAPEGTVIDLSWYGDAEVSLSLGGAFHAGRLGIRASQVGTVSPARSGPPHDRPTGWRSRSTCCATPRSTRSSPASRASTSCRPSWPGWPPETWPALCHTITYGEG